MIWALDYAEEFVPSLLQKHFISLYFLRNKRLSNVTP